MPEYLKKMGVTLVARTAAHMGEREAYAAPKARRIFYRPALFARLKFGDAGASLILLHELAHVLLHRENGGAEKAWLKEENTRISFASEEESAEWQATTFALCLRAPANVARDAPDAEALGLRFGLDKKHAELRFETLRLRLPRKIPDIYEKLRAELSGTANPIAKGEQTDVARLCPDCGFGHLVDIDGKHYCAICRTFGAKLQDGDTMSLDLTL